MLKKIAFIVCLLVSFSVLLTSCGIISPYLDNYLPYSPTYTNTSSASSIPAYVPGTREENTYKSDWLNLQISLPEGWQFSTEEELASFKENVLGESPSDDYELYTEFLAFSPENNVIAYLLVENANVEVPMGIYVNNLLKGIRESSDITVIEDGTSVQTIAGQEYTILSFEQITTSITLQQTIFIRAFGTYFATLALTCLPDTQATADEFLNAITIV